MHTRQKLIMEMLQRSGRIGVHETARELGVSEMTLRRNLRALENDGSGVCNRPKRMVNYTSCIHKSSGVGTA